MLQRITIFITLLCFLACSSDEETSTTLFQEIKKADSGLIFNNKITETNAVNFYRHQYLYNGGGVGIGDINNDGLSDVYLSSTQGKDKLFINKGKMRFEDISEKAGIDKYDGCKTGINIIDINQDGWKDIYVARAGWSKKPADRTNLLFINNQDGTFTESAAKYGLNDSNCSVQSVFFDYDKDGDLDMYLTNHPQIFNEPMVNLIAKTKNPPVESTDKLYRNDGNNHFTDVSKEAGIMNYGYGLGMIAADFNNDNWTDLYITSDFAPRDLYYINQKDGTFKEALTDHFAHSSYFAMGVDMVDINQDQSLDLFIDEMLAADNKRQKTNMAPMDMERFNILTENGFYYQYMRNSFFINNGEGYFSDVAPYSGIDKSDWSWSCLFGDYDLDGDDDLLIANGWLKDTQDKDFSKKTNKLAEKTNNKLSFQDVTKMLKSTKLVNYAFEYEGDLKFKKVSKEWGFDFKGFSHGMATGDLDNDGDLDIIVNNNNDNVSLYRNTKKSKNFLSIQLDGPEGNKDGLNAKVYVYSDKRTQFKEFQTCRGFQSSVDYNIHFGFSDDELIDRLEVVWPDGKYQNVTSVKKGKLMRIKYAPEGIKNLQKPTRLFEKKDDVALFVHEENSYNDYDDQILIPHKLSQLGPALAKADVNGDGLEDYFVGGSAGNVSRMYIQNSDGNFGAMTQSAFENHRKYEDIIAHFFDYDKDGDLDLLVASGSSEFIKQKDLLKDRIYQNDGKGRFSFVHVLPSLNLVTGSVSSHDYDADGDLDLFISSRLEPGFYPKPTDAYLLENNKGRFTDVTDKIAPEMKEIGLICSSTWADVNADGKSDLIVAGEWTDIIAFIQGDDGFEKQNLLKEAKVGWWNVLKTGDFDGDGHVDIFAGNLGENYKYTASDEAPFEIYSEDMDQNGKYDIVLGYNQDGTLFPVRGLQCSSEQMPSLAEKFPSYDEFGDSDLFKVYGTALESALHYKANCFSSGILWGAADGTFTFEKLNYESQLAPIQDVVIEDVDADGDMDFIAVGNWYMAEVETPRADAGIGVVLINEGGRKLRSLPYSESGFLARYDARKIISVKNSKGESVYFVGNNNGKLEEFVGR